MPYYERYFYVYFLANRKDGVLYIGVTNSLKRRIDEHKRKVIKGFTEKYNVDKLVYYETYTSPSRAIYREKCLKKWLRAWKINLIEQENPNWNDLYDSIF